MRHGAGKNEKTKHDEHPVVGHVASFADEVGQCDQDGKIGHRDQRVRDNVEPDNLRPHQVGLPMRHEAGVENVPEKINHRDAIPQKMSRYISSIAARRSEANK
jgi:hypothetical protein